MPQAFLWLTWRAIVGDISLINTLVMLTSIKDTVRSTKGDLVSATAIRRSIIKDAGDIIRHVGRDLCPLFPPFTFAYSAYMLHINLTLAVLTRIGRAQPKL